MRHAAWLLLATWLAGACPARATVYWGDVHAHSGVSNDGSGTVDNFFTVARDVVGLDFVVLSDHDIFTTPAEWDLSRAVAASFTQDGRFVALSGTEWTHEWHMNAYFVDYPEPQCLLLTCASAESFYDFVGPRVRTAAAAAHVNHPADVYKVQWHRIDDAITTNVEIWNTGGAGDQEFGFGNALWALRLGFRLGLVGVSDDHHLDQRPLLMGTGLTGCDLDALTHENILAALRERRCYGTDGARILLGFDVGGTPMGAELGAPLHAVVVANLAVMGTDTPTSIEIVRNGTVVATKTDCTGPGCVFSAPVEIVDPHTFIYARVLQANGKRAWTSPVWVRGECRKPSACLPGRLAPGGGPPADDCLAEWAVAPRLDRGGGRRRARVTCTDGDPACDFAGTAEECTFRVGICLGMRDRRLPSCRPTSVEGYELVQPGEDVEHTDREGPDFQNRRTLLGALRALGAVPPPGACTPLLDVRVPDKTATDPGQRELAGIAHAGEASDNDWLVLRCRPGRRRS